MSRGKRPKHRSRKRGGHLRKRVAILIAVAIAIPIAIVSALLVLPWSGGPSQPRAAIVDQLSLTQPNPAFVQTATSMLEEAGYAVDYYPGEEVTVEFYKGLPSQGYELVILRVHSSRTEDGKYTGLFTAEPFSLTRYPDEPALALARYREGGRGYLSIMPDFVKSSMKARFQETLVIMMGCDGLSSDGLAQAFVQKGAKAFIGWDGPVSAPHTDAATERLLQHLLVDKLTARESVAQTMEDVGPDPQYQSTLRAYP